MNNMNILAISLILIANFSLSQFDYNEELDDDINVDTLNNNDQEIVLLSSNNTLSSNEAKQIKDKFDIYEISKALVVLPDGVIGRPEIHIDDNSLQAIQQGIQDVYEIKYTYRCAVGKIDNTAYLRVSNCN